MMTKYVLAPSLALLLFSCQQTEEKVNNLNYTENDPVSYERDANYQASTEEERQKIVGKEVEDKNTASISEIFAEDIKKEEAAKKEETVAKAEVKAETEVKEPVVPSTPEIEVIVENKVAGSGPVIIPEKVKTPEIKSDIAKVEDPKEELPALETEPIKYERDTAFEKTADKEVNQLLEKDVPKTEGVDEVIVDGRAIDRKVHLEQEKAKAEAAAKAKAEADRIAAEEKAKADKIAAEKAAKAAYEQGEKVFRYYDEVGIYHNTTTGTYYWKHGKYLIDGKKLPRFIELKGSYDELTFESKSPDAHWAKEYKKYLDSLPGIK